MISLPRHLMQPREAQPPAFFLPSTLKFIFPLQTIVLDCAFSHSILALPEGNELGKDMVPKRIFFTKGVGKHRERLTSFELALRDAGIAAQNWCGYLRSFRQIANCSPVKRV